MLFRRYYWPCPSAGPWHCGKNKHANCGPWALAGDGVPLTTPALGEALVEYLNRAEPLASCRFCHGGAGPLAAHTQLTKADVRAGRLRPLRVLGA